MNVCKVSWCESEVAKTGYCNRHYLQIRRHGDILPIDRNRNTPQEFEFYGDDCHVLLYDKSGNKITSAIVDKADYVILNQYKYNFSGRRYVRISGKSKEGYVFLHQLILGTRWVDHIDGDRLNNRRSNLRPCTNQQNQFNSKPQMGRLSKYKGVSIVRGKNKPYTAGIQINMKRIHLGSFYTEENAAKAYNEAAIKYFGEFARLNEI